MAFWNSITKFVAGGAVARASADAATPVLEPVKQHAWSKNKLRVLDLHTTAQLVAQAIIESGTAEDEAARNGYGPNRLMALVKMMQTTPGMADLDKMLNRTTISRQQFNYSLAKHQIDPQFWDALFDLTNDKLSVADVAAAVQQGHMPNDGILPPLAGSVAPPPGWHQPTAPDHQPPLNVPLTTIDIPPIAEAAAQGYDEDRLKVRANLSGLPPGPHDLLQMWNRNEITEEAVDAGIREGHMKTKWGQAFKRMRWAVLSPQEYASARLRQWVTAEESYVGGALTGHTQEQMDLLFLNRGRPASPTQMWRAWARKIVGPRGVPVEFEDHAKAIAISDIRPEYAEMLWGIRFNYPTLFQLGRLVQAGAINPETAATWAGYNLYGEDVVTALTAYWRTIYPGAGGQTGTAADKNVTKARTQLWTATHRSYVAQEIDSATATSALGTAGIDPAAVSQVIATWDAERALIRAQLSPADIRKAFQQGDVNASTGAAWTQADALAALEARGWSAAEAQSYLNIPYKG